MNANSLGSTTASSLLERAKCHDEQAWEKIVRLYSPLVYRLCRLQNLQADDAHDVVQDVFRAVYGNLNRFRRDRPGDSFRAWLLTISKNKIRDFARRRDRHPRGAGGTDMLERFNQVPDGDWDFRVRTETLTPTRT